MIKRVGIIGGGLAGLCLAIQCAKQGKQVMLFEKGNFPRHKVCGEYISVESYNFLKSCGVDLLQIGGVAINQLRLSSPEGNTFTSDLPLGGIGISRYFLDEQLYKQAIKLGVEFVLDTKVDAVHNDGGTFTVLYNGLRQQFDFVALCHGKRSNLDVNWQRQFTQSGVTRLNNFMGVKYHVRYNMPNNEIALHYFDGGYAGISRIEDDKFCFCYLSSAKHLKQHKSIAEVERQVLCKNPHLQHIFDNAIFLFEEPVTIAQISFDNKELSIHGMPMLGDSAGMIVPLCGNGMSMAMHSSKLLADILGSNAPANTISERYMLEWRKHFAQRMWVGRTVQRLLSKPWQHRLAVGLLKKLPFLTKRIIASTHGKPF
jgi:menaquinone-9 beta-reductase